ncbi:hypothetical protein A5881_002935 [Enterococcus termitis]|nr:hypothetical protein A5881_002410 [Enterococcus termitis]
MNTLFILIVCLVYLSFLFQRFSDKWLGEWERFEKRIDGKIELNDTFNRIENAQKRFERTIKK